MFCEKCGSPLPDDAVFCENCGAKVTEAEKKPRAAAKPDTPRVSPAEAGVETQTAGGSGSITLCPDGKYRWYYEYPMLKNPVILFTIWKVMLIAALVPALVVFFSDLSDGFFYSLGSFISVYAIAFGIIFVLSVIGYFILAAAYGFKYIVLFEMDEKTITHAQQDRQFKQAQAIGWLTAFAGAAAGKPGTAGAGILAASKSSMTSEFKNVSEVAGLRKKNTIKVNQLLAKNQVYVHEKDYDFVWNYITSRCVKAKIR